MDDVPFLNHKNHLVLEKNKTGQCEDDSAIRGADYVGGGLMVRKQLV